MYVFVMWIQKMCIYFSFIISVSLQLTNLSTIIILLADIPSTDADIFFRIKIDNIYYIYYYYKVE